MHKAVHKKWEKPQKSWHGIWKKSRAKKTRLFWNHKEKKESPLCHIDGHLSSRKCGVREGRVVLRGGHRERRLWSLRSFYWIRLVCVPDDCCERWWILLQGYQLVTDKQPTQCQLTTKKSGGRSKVAKHSKVRMSRRMGTSSTTQVSQIMGKHWRSWVASWKKFWWSSITWIVMEKTIRRGFFRTWVGEKYRIGNVSSFLGNEVYFCQYSSPKKSQFSGWPGL